MADPETMRRCPVCRKALTQQEYEKALGLWQAKHQHIKHLEDERKNLRRQAQLLKKERTEARREAAKRIAAEHRRQAEAFRQQRSALEARLTKRFDKEITRRVRRSTVEQERQMKRQAAEVRQTRGRMTQLERKLKTTLERDGKQQEEIKRLREQLEKGITPQIEGLLEEDKLLAKLQELFPHDRFEHTGKGGNIVQTAVEGVEPAGMIVYECKKVKGFSQSHVDQAARARETRKADFAVLVTNALPAKRQFYHVSKTVFVISPLSVEPVTYTLRESLVRMARLRLDQASKIKAVDEVFKYLTGNEYTNKVNAMAGQLMGLADDLRAEITGHRRAWLRRYGAYRGLYLDLGAIDVRLQGLLAAGRGAEPPKQLTDQRQAYPRIEELEQAKERDQRE